MKVRVIRQRAKSRYVVYEGFKFLRDALAMRCRTYSQGCPICEGWRFRDEQGRFAYNWDELRNYMENEHE
jgi:hypothetical protein